MKNKMILFVEIFISFLLWTISSGNEGNYAECPSSDYLLRFEGVVNKDRVEFVNSIPDLKYATICAWTTTNNKRIIPGTLWGYFVDGQVDSMLVEGIVKDAVPSIRIGVNGEMNIISKTFKANTEYYICLQYLMPENKVEIYIDGHKEETINFPDLGGKILGGGKLMLGQRQGCSEGCFDTKRAYDGRIRNMMTWERLLSAMEMREIITSDICPRDTVLDSGTSKIIDMTKRKCIQTSQTLNNTGDKTQFIEVHGSLPELEYATICLEVNQSSFTRIPQTFASYSLGNRTILAVGGETTDQGGMLRFELDGEVHLSPGMFFSYKYPICFLFNFKHQFVSTFLTIWGIGMTYFKSITSLPAGGKLVVGQLQRCEGGCFDKSRGYSGTIENFHLWDRILYHFEVVNFNKGICTNDALVRLTKDNIYFYDYAGERNSGLAQ